MTARRSRRCAAAAARAPPTSAAAPSASAPHCAASTGMPKRGTITASVPGAERAAGHDPQVEVDERALHGDELDLGPLRGARGQVERSLDPRGALHALAPR